MSDTQFELYRLSESYISFQKMKKSHNYFSYCAFSQTINYFFLHQMSNFYIFFSHKQTNKLSALLSCSCFELLFQWFHLSTIVFVCLSVCFKCEICCIKTKKLFSFTAEGPQKGCAAAK